MEILLIVQSRKNIDDIEYWAIPGDLQLISDNAIIEFYELGLCLDEWQLKDLTNLNICRVVHYLWV